MQTKPAVFASHIYYAQDKMLIEQHDKKKKTTKLVLILVLILSLIKRNHYLFK